MAEKPMRIKDIARELGVHYKTVQYWRKAKNDFPVHYMTPGGTILVEREAFNEWKQGRREAT